MGVYHRAGTYQPIKHYAFFTKFTVHSIICRNNTSDNDNLCDHKMETILLQVIADSGLTSWLVEQAGTIVVMGVVIWWLAKRYEKAENDKTELAKEVIKLTVAYETKLDSDKEKDAEIKHLLTEIRDTVKAWQK